MAERPFEPVPNTPLVADPTGDAIWKRWLQGLQRFLASAVRGPGSSTDNAVARWDGTSGTFLNNSGVIIDDSNNVTGVAGLTATSITDSGLTSGRVVFAGASGLLTTGTTQSANTVFSGPTTGAAAVPTFRALVAADLPAGTGTVTSVAVSGSNGIGVSGSPITTSGTVTLSLGAITPTSVSTGSVTSSTLTSGRLVYTGTSGLLTDSANITVLNNSAAIQISLSGSVTNQSSLVINNNDTSTGNANLQLGVESASSGDAFILMFVDGGSSWYSGIDNSASDIYAIGTSALGSADKFRITTTGLVSTVNKIYPGTDGAAFQSAAGIYAGTGAPNNANGNDGDFYLRGDGGVLTTIYQRRAGAWVGVV